jgi:hypothetical protein
LLESVCLQGASATEILNVLPQSRRLVRQLSYGHYGRGESGDPENGA